MLGKLRHPGIVCIKEYRSDPGGHFLVMELVAGETLQTLLAAGPVPLGQALDWAAQLQEGDGKNGVVANVINNWGRKDPASAARYLESMNDTPARANAIPGLADQWANSDPASAAKWAAGFAGGAAQASAYTNIAEAVASW